MPISALHDGLERIAEGKPVKLPPEAITWINIIYTELEKMAEPGLAKMADPDAPNDNYEIYLELSRLTEKFAEIGLDIQKNLVLTTLPVSQARGSQPPIR